MISFATVSEKSTALRIISVSNSSKTPPFWLSLAMILISSSLWVNSLSLAGLMPKSFKVIAARKSKILIQGKKSIQNQ